MAIKRRPFRYKMCVRKFHVKDNSKSKIKQGPKEARDLRVPI